MTRYEPLGDEPRAMMPGRLALMGGEIARARMATHSIHWKADGSMVTDVDVAIQERLCAEIQSAFPQDGILAEEDALPTGRVADARHWWVLDPLDGTANYGLGIPGFAVSVGLLRDGVPVAGAVYDPTADQLYAACAGRGAWLNGRRLRVQPQPLGSHSFVAIRTPYHERVPGFVARWMCRHRLRRFGSTALQLCYVASGALALIHDQRAFLWDLAGAAPVLLEAGGVLTTPDGHSLLPLHPGRYRDEPIAFLAGNPLAHAEGLAEILREGLPAEKGVGQPTHGD